MSPSRRRRRSSAPAVIVVLILLALAAAAARLLPRPRVVASRVALPRSSSPAMHTEPAAPTPGAEPEASPEAETPASITAHLYFLRLTGGKERLVPVEEPVSARSPARAALTALLATPPEGCRPPLPAGVTLRSVKVRDGVAVADFSRELVSEFRGGSDNEGVAVYSIVNTLCSLPGVERAQILVDGQRVDSLGGHLDTSTPLAANSELVTTGG